MPNNEMKYENKNSYQKVSFFNEKRSMLSIGMSCSVGTNGQTKNYYPTLTVSSVKLTEENKFAKTEDGKNDAIMISLRLEDIVKLQQGLKEMMAGEIVGVITSKLSGETNTGSRMDVANEDEGFTVTLMAVENGEVVKEISTVLTETSYMSFFNSEGQEERKAVNTGILKFKAMIDSCLAMVGLGKCITDIYGWNSSSANSGSLNSPRQITKRTVAENDTATVKKTVVKKGDHDKLKELLG